MREISVQATLEVLMALSLSMLGINVAVVTKKGCITVLDNVQGNMFARSKKTQKICNKLR